MFQILREDIQCVFARDPAARSSLEVVTAYPGIHALWLHRFSHWLWGLGLRWPARLSSHLGRFLTGIEIHPGAQIGRRFFIDHGMGVVIGETAVIGNDCTLYHGVTLGGTSWQPGKRHPTLEDHVVIGAGAKVLGPITIGTGARVGSNAVVVKDVPAGATVVGVPGQILRPADERDQQREATARRIGFEAYGGSRDLPDPVALAMNQLLDHIHALESRMGELQEELKALQAEPDAAERTAGAWTDPHP